MATKIEKSYPIFRQSTTVEWEKKKNRRKNSERKLLMIEKSFQFNGKNKLNERRHEKAIRWIIYICGKKFTAEKIFLYCFQPEIEMSKKKIRC